MTSGFCKCVYATLISLPSARGLFTRARSFLKLCAIAPLCAKADAFAANVEANLVGPAMKQKDLDNRDKGPHFEGPSLKNLSDWSRCNRDQAYKPAERLLGRNRSCRVTPLIRLNGWDDGL